MNRRDFILTTGLGALAPFYSHAALNSDSFNKIWLDFSSKFITKDGRVVDTGNNSITHTEGLGTALLAAQFFDDKQKFEQLLKFLELFKRKDGLYSWKWAPGKGVVDPNNATDGDLYIAWALLRAGIKWKDSSYIRQSGELAKAIRTECLVQTDKGSFLLPGKEGFISLDSDKKQSIVLNPSYFVFPAFKDLQLSDPSPIWKELFSNAATLSNSLKFGKNELPCDWIVLNDPIIPWKERPARFGYEAIRLPLFLIWGGLPQHNVVKSFAKYSQKSGFPAWVDVLSQEKANYAAPNGFEAIARLSNKQTFGTPFKLPPVDSDYFSSSLTLLTAMAIADTGSN